MDQLSDEEVDIREEEEEEDSDKEDQDLDQMFGAWLGELDKLTQSLDDGRPAQPQSQQKAPLRQETNMANFSYRFSIYNINEALNQGENVDLDALMADLSSIEQELSTINSKPNSSMARLGLTDTKVHKYCVISPACPTPQASLSMDEAARQTSSHSLSSASSTSATVRRSGSSQRQHRRTGSVGTVSEHEEEQAAKLKAENIRVALEKIKEAQVKKLVIRVHLSDESSKTMMVDERQTVRQVLDSLLEKSHSGYSADWSLVETLSELQMERIFEDHENLVENLLNWTRDSQNRLMFTERIEKYAVFKNPQNYLLGRKETCEMTERNKEALLEECFGGSSVSVPEMEGLLWLKEDGKKSWKKRYFLLRASGIYYVPKGKAKASRDLVCFLQLDHVNVYLGQDYKSKYKAPTDYCMVLKHPQIQKKSQYIKYLCCDDIRTLQQWINSIRIAKYGKQLYINFQDAMRKTEAAYDWSSLSSSSIKSGSSSSSLPESQSNHSSQSDSGVSEMASAGHTRSQSVVSSIFSDAWRRGTQGEVQAHTTTRCLTFFSLSSNVLSHRSPSASLPSYLPPPPDNLEINGLPLPPPPEPDLTSCPQLSNAGLQQFLAKKFPNMAYDFTPPAGEDSCPPPPPLSDASPLASWPPSHNAPPPAPPKTFTGGLPPQTAPKPSGPSSLPVALSPVSPSEIFGSHVPIKKQQSFSTGHSPNQPPPTLPKQHSLSSKNLALSPSSSSTSIAAATSSLVKQIVNQFPGNSAPCSLSASNSMEGSKLSAPQSPPAVKSKPKWQPGGAPQSPEFPPPPPDTSAEDFPPPPVSSSSKTGSPIKKSPSTSSTGSTKRGPPPTPQRASSIRTGSPSEGQDEKPKKVESLVSKFGQAPQTSTSSSSSSRSNSLTNDPSGLPAPLPKPGKLNLANLPLALQGLQASHQSTEFPSPPPPPPPSQHPQIDSSPDFFPPPPSDSELFPPPPHLSEIHQPPKVAVVNPQPQLHKSAPTSLSSSWKQSSLKKGAVLPPATNRRPSNPAQYDQMTSKPLSPPPLSQTPPPSLPSFSSSSSPVPPTSPKSPGPSSLALKPLFLEDLNRTLKRKSISRHGSLTSSHLISSKMEPVGTMDDMALLPPPPPELLQQQQQQQRGLRGQSQTLSRHHAHSQSAKHANISGYATLRRGPPPAPPKRDQSTKLTSEW
uniref:Ras association (RalGDS/AF-6) and pleckstrin homology domains 1a n=1 Tax=Takifugu rubripes TaxID=31033 RepID=H2UTQ4_TAKRU